MSAPSLTVRQASVGELPEVIQLYDMVARWLVEAGVTQWSYSLSHDFRRLVEGEVGKGEVYLAWCAPDPAPVGVFQFEWSPNAFWRGATPDARRRLSL